MAQRKQKRVAAAPDAHNDTLIALTVGDWIDALDEVGVWNVAQVVAAPTNNSVRVRFQGYSEREDEVLSLASDCVAPFHTYTWTVKCWAKYKNWPYWPALLTVLVPGTAQGATCLRKMTALFVDFVDDACFAKRLRCWVPKSAVEPFEREFERYRKGSAGSSFELALERVLLSNATVKMPKFVYKGVLPALFTRSVATPLPQMRKSLGTQLMMQQLATSTERYNHKFVCDGAAQIANPDVSTESAHRDLIPIMNMLCEESESEERRKRKRKRKLKRFKKLSARPKRSTSQRIQREVASKEREDSRRVSDALSGTRDTTLTSDIPATAAEVLDCRFLVVE